MIFCFVALLMMQSHTCVHYDQKGGRNFADSITVSVMTFTNSASLAKATFPQTMTEALRDGIQRQSRLKMVPRDGILNYEGSVTGYSVSPVAIAAGGSNQSAMNRLTITLNVKYTDGVDDKFSFDSNFSRYSDFSSSVPLASVEDQLIKDISDQLVQDIINKSINAW
ncbi:MAG TPA: LPS assembly lipoprotein LptE [Bacteroidia bacterium]|nr:LPS assembly lipoprotein LptE [Bacteroidia bacterium]